jgi:MFS transporter, DHA3 family, macrolide efflux protein
MSVSLQNENVELEDLKPLRHNKNFVLIMTARFVSLLGDSVHGFTLTWYILNVIGQGKVLGWMLFFSTLPAIIIGPFAGVLSDRYDRRKIMIIMDIIRGCIALLLGYLVMMNQAPLWVILIITVMLSICSSIYFPASGALFPNLVHQRQLIRANAIATFLGTSTAIIGQIFGGFLYDLINAQGLFIINGFTFFIAATCEFFVFVPNLTNSIVTKSNHYFKNLTEGFKYVYKTKALLAMLLFGATVNFFFFPIHNVVQPYIGNKILLLDSRQFGFIIAFFQAGMILSMLFLQIIPQPKKKYRFMLWSMLAQSVGLILLAIPILPFIKPLIGSTTIFVVLYSTIILGRGLAFGLTNVPMQVVFQSLTPDEYRGRVFALQGAAFQSFMMISMLVAGNLVDIFPAYALCIFAGVFMGLACIFMFRVKATQDI